MTGRQPHDLVFGQYATVNAYGRIYGAPELSTDDFPIFDRSVTVFRCALTRVDEVNDFRCDAGADINRSDRTKGWDSLTAVAVWSGLHW